MTDERRFDRIARAWLDLMPDEAPDRAIAAVLQAVETTPQRRAPWRPAIRRIAVMPRLTIAAAVATALVIALGGILLWPRLSAPVGHPSPTATPSVSPSAASTGALPPELRHVWIGELRRVPGAETDRSVLTIAARDASYIDEIVSDASSPAPARLASSSRRRPPAARAATWGRTATPCRPAARS